MSRLTGGFAVLVLAFAGAALGAPVPREAPPDPMAKPAIGVLQAPNGGLVIGEVYPNMPAAKAGIRPGDKIVRVGALVPVEFGQVQAHVCSFRPGAVVEVEVERGSERKVFKVQLVPRPASYERPTFPANPFPDD